jgi:hypothetical protein
MGWWRAVPLLLVSCAAGLLGPVRVEAGCPAGKGKTYEVGPGGKLQRLADVPWDRLGAGDRVLVRWRREPYREQILLSARGTAEQPVRVCGLAGPRGELPVVTGEGARTARGLGLPHAATQERGIVIFSLRGGQRWGVKPSHVVLEGLEVRGAHPRFTFRDDKGRARSFRDNAAAVFIERGEHITVRNCTITDSANGLFVASGDSEEVLSRDIVVEGNYIHGNGVADSYYEHNAYTEAAGMLFQRNRFGPLRPGAGGNALKDRSAGTVIRYNWIEGGAHLLDLVEPEDSVKLTRADPRFLRTYVYGNVLINRPDDGPKLVHYGGDNGNTEIYRKGTLYFFHNTVVVRGDELTRWGTALLRLETEDESAEVSNNVVYREGSTHLFLLHGEGRLRLGRNWVSEGFEPRQKHGRLAIAGLGELIAGQGSPFVDLRGGDLRVRPGCDAARAGAPLPTALPTEHRPTRKYVVHQGEEPRAGQAGQVLLGALD